MADETIVVDATDQEVEAPVDFIQQRKDAMYDRITGLNGPSKEQIDNWKLSVPGGRLRSISLDNVRFYVVRGIGGLELSQIQKNIPQNSSNPEYDAQIEAGVLCTLWTNSTPEKKLNALGLRTGTAGLPSTLWQLIMTLSDYAEPADFQTCSVEL